MTSLSEILNNWRYGVEESLREKLKARKASKDLSSPPLLTDEHIERIRPLPQRIVSKLNPFRRK